MDTSERRKMVKWNVIVVFVGLVLICLLQSHGKISNDAKPPWFDKLFGEEEYPLFISSQRNSIFFEHGSRGSSFVRSHHYQPKKTLKPSSIWKIGELLFSHNEFIDLLSIADKIDEVCPQNSIADSQRQAPILFRSCTGNFSNVLVLANNEFEPVNSVKSTISKYPLVIPHLFAVRDVVVNWKGQIFGFLPNNSHSFSSVMAKRATHPCMSFNPKKYSAAKQSIDAANGINMTLICNEFHATPPTVLYHSRNYRRGGCVDLSWASGWHNITLFYHHFSYASFHEPVLLMNHPYEGNVFHEIIEMHAQLFSFQPILRHYPRMKIVMSAAFYFTLDKYIPLLQWYGVIQHNISELNIHYMSNESEFVYAPYAIAPLLGECCMLLPVLAKEMQKRIWMNIPMFLGIDHEKHGDSALQYHEGNISFLSPLPLKYIVLYDRKFDSSRQLLHAEDVFLLLEQTFHPLNYSVVRFDGKNATFSETVALFAQAKAVIGVHGAGLTNILFMQPLNTYVIEIRPENYIIETIEHLGRSLHLNYHTFSCGKGRYKGPIPIKPHQLVSFVRDIVK